MKLPEKQKGEQSKTTKMSNNNGKNAKKVVPVFQININVMSDGRVNVNGFPNCHTAISEIMDRAELEINRYFIELAKKGQLDKFNRKKIEDYQHKYWWAYKLPGSGL